MMSKVQSAVYANLSIMGKTMLDGKVGTTAVFGRMYTLLPAMHEYSTNSMMQVQDMLFDVDDVDIMCMDGDLLDIVATL